MKFFSLTLALVILTAAFFSDTPKLAATYNDTVNGAQTAAPQAEGIAVNLTADGDLPGMSKLRLLRSESNVTGGTWTITVLPSNADASSSERGTLTGAVTSGTLTLNINGTLASALAVQISIQSGTGEFSNVTSGTATINISADTGNPSQLHGTLVLSF